MAGLIGTAGHVDHGKTTLVRALTGIDTDRLPEEKKRGLTIDIGFAHLDLPGQGRVSLIDVPGHEKFIGNMLVGALGMDVALLCVAADESVMPQTVEHFQIIGLLPVQRLVVAVTRCDLVDEETLGFTVAEIEELLAGTRFEGSPVLPVSAVRGTGLDTVITALTEAVASSTPTEATGWYLPVDRVFSVKGHGTVVTGTLAQGELREGDSAVLMPEGTEVRVRSIQIHDSQEHASRGGTRTAVNISGAKPEQVHRGQLLGQPGTVWATKIVDAKVQVLQGVELKHGSRVRVSIGADEAMARIHLNDADSDLIQLRFERTVGAVKGQPLIVRRYSPSQLVAGGRVIVPMAEVRRKREKVNVVDEGLSMEDAVEQAVGHSESGAMTDEVCRIVGASATALGDVFESLKASGRLVGFAGRWLTKSQFEATRKSFVDALSGMHKEFPTQISHQRETVIKRTGLAWTGKPLDRLVSALEAQGVLRAQGTQVALAEFRPTFSGRQRELLDKVIAALSANGLSFPDVTDVARTLNVPPQAVTQTINVGIGAGEIVRIDEGMYCPQALLDATVTSAREKFAGRPFAASEFRDQMGTTRKFAIPILEYFDSKGVTKRMGDQRIFII